MKINCLSCGHAIGLDDMVYSDYSGLIRCYACRAMLNLTITDGRINRMQWHAPEAVATVSPTEAAPLSNSGKSAV